MHTTPLCPKNKGDLIARGDALAEIHMTIQKKLLRWLVQILPAFAFAALLTGCGPEEWIVWAPDGEQAIVREATPRIIDSAGNTMLFAIGEDESIAAWLPDSRRVLVVRKVGVRSWEEYAELLGANRVEVIVQLAEELSRAIATYRGELAEFGDSASFKSWMESVQSRGEEMDSAIYFLHNSQPDVLKPLLEASAKKDAAEGGKGGPEVDVPRIHELHLRSVAGPDVSDDRLLLRSAAALGMLAVSPRGQSVAFVQEEPDNLRLYVLALEPGARPLLVEAGADFAAWSPDGQDLAYSKSSIPRRGGKSELALGSISRRRVCTPDGEILAEAGAGEDLAGLILPPYPARVAWLPDGRILFAGAKFSLPAITQNLPDGFTLFALRLRPVPVIEQLISDAVPARLTERVNYFSVSPDGSNVAILGKSGAVSVLTLATKSFATLQDSSPQFADRRNDDSMLVPAWRNADELSMLVPAGDRAGGPDRAEVVIASLRGGRRAISNSWPDSAGLPRLQK